MQAEHIPVHLGAMPAAVAAVLDEDTRRGRAWILNDPYRGGTHLPDITVITPIFAGDQLIAFAANRAHHADVGGPTPGSMPADSRTLADEGVVIEPRVLDEDAIARAERADAPARPAPRRPARAARGRAASASRRLAELHERVGAEHARRARSRRCSTTPSGGRAHACRSSRTAPAVRATCWRRARATSRSRSSATVDGDELTLDFTGTADQHEGNLNCPLAVTRSACYFAIRVLTDPDIPPSAGAYRPVEGGRSRGLPAQRALAGRRGRRQRRDLVAGRRRGARRVRPRARTGDDEQRHARIRGRRVLRDDRRRSGRLPRRRRAERACTSR